MLKQHTGRQGGGAGLRQVCRESARSAGAALLVRSACWGLPAGVSA